LLQPLAQERCSQEIPENPEKHRQVPFRQTPLPEHSKVEPKAAAKSQSKAFSKYKNPKIDQKLLTTSDALRRKRKKPSKQNKI
jgi:hypothetical protein